MYLATTNVHEYPKDRIKEGFTRENCYAIIKWVYADARKYGEQTIYLSKNREHYIRVSYDRRKYYSYIDCRQWVYTLLARRQDQLGDLLYAILPKKYKRLWNRTSQ